MTITGLDLDDAMSRHATQLTDHVRVIGAQNAPTTWRCKLASAHLWASALISPLLSAT
jgi:hypothetical protein